MNNAFHDKLYVFDDIIVTATLKPPFEDLVSLRRQWDQVVREGVRENQQRTPVRHFFGRGLEQAGHGGGEGTRTLDFFDATEALFQLSYTPEGSPTLAHGPSAGSRSGAGPPGRAHLERPGTGRCAMSQDRPGNGNGRGAPRRRQQARATNTGEAPDGRPWHVAPWGGVPQTRG